VVGKLPNRMYVEYKMMQFQKNNGIFSFIKFLAWLFILLFMLEVFIRIFVIKSPYLHFVPELGVVPVDNSIAVWGVEGYGVTHYLANGEIVTPQDSGISVVVLGDSYTEALQVHDDEKYVSVAESILHERGYEMNLHNLGASGRCMADYVYIAPFVQRTYSPDIVVLQVSETDFMESMDVSRQNFFTINESSVELTHNENYYVFNLDLRNALYSTGLGSLANYKLTPVIKEQRLRLARAAAAQPAEQDATTDETLTSGDLNGLELKPTVFNSTMVQAQVNSLKKAYPNVKLVFFLIPNTPVVQNDIPVLSDDSDNVLVDMLNGLSDVSMVLYPQEEFVQLYTVQRKFPRGFFNTLPGVGHLNSDGNYTAGAALADHLEGIAR
jgi:hypothetical protein